MTDIIDYNSDLEHLLKIHAEECESFSILHRYSFEKYNERSNYINIPVIILSSAIGFATGIDIGYDKMNIILGVSSIFVGIIKSIDTYFQLGKRSESHRLCSLQFQQINKKIMIELSLKRDQRISAKDMLQIIKTDIKNLQDIAPLIDEEIVEMFKKNYGIIDPSSNKIKFTAHTPNLCNGLSQVTINGEKSSYDDDDEMGTRNRGRRRRSSRERNSRGSSRGSSPASYDESDNDDDNNGEGNSRINRKRVNKQDKQRKSDGNVSSASNSSGFMSSVSNFFNKGVNLIKGNTPPPPPSVTVSHSNSKRHHNASNTVIELTNVVVDKFSDKDKIGGNNEIISDELKDILNKKSSNNSSNNSTSKSIRSPSQILDTPVISDFHFQQLQQLQQLQLLQQLQQTPHLQSHTPVNFVNTLSNPMISADLIYNTHNSHRSHNTQSMIHTPSLHGSTNNSVIGGNTPRILSSAINEIDNIQNQSVNIEIHEIENSINNPLPILSTPSSPSFPNINNLNNDKGNDDDDDGALM